MNILVFNCGSSSLNSKVFTVQPGGGLSVAVRGKAHRVGVQGSEPAFIEHQLGGRHDEHTIALPDHRTAAGLVLSYLRDQGVPLHAIGHRFVHGGSDFKQSVLLTPDVRPRIQQCLPLAPIHNPNSLSVIEVCDRELPGLPQYLTFDTAFHAGLPPESYTYALPASLSQHFGLRKFGFHGLSYQYVTQRAAEHLGRPLQSLKLIACHLGTGGSSVVAVRNGQSLDTSMGYSPLAGLVMSTRTGDLDPAVPGYLIAQHGYDPARLNQLFNKKSGLIGLSGFSSDLRDLVHAMDEDNNPRATLAFEIYTYRLKKTIGAFAVLLNGIDALLFTDDIGVQNGRVREAACRGLEWCGIGIDPLLNDQAPAGQIFDIGRSGWRVRVLSIPTDEEWVIATEGIRLLGEVNHAHS
ncbi:MAG: acetate/propionate family kinase [Anaerolineaceae bacterium]|nr:acetate/propionate family kinase [Anaerolineaceae bacterium]